MNTNALLAVLGFVVMAPFIALAFQPESEGRKMDSCARACASGGLRLGRWSPSAGCVCDGNTLDAGAE